MKQTVTITGENMNVVVNEVKSAAKKLATRAELRIAALKASGVDTSMYFPLGEDMVVKLENGIAVPVDMTDDTERIIIEGGYVNHYKLFRRWTMAQMFNLLRRMKETGRSFNETLQFHGYEYSWRVLVNELNAQSKMYKHGDLENFKARNRWFNASTAWEMADDYIEKLRKYIENNLMWNYCKNGRKPKHTCKGVHYIRLGQKDIFVSDITSKVINPLREASRKIRISDSPLDVYEAVKKFNSLRHKMRSDVKQSDAFINAYKGSGAYYTMRNLIMFHGARFASFPTEASSLVYIDQKSISYNDEGWRMIGIMKTLIEEAGISVDGKISEWRAKQ